MFLNAQIFVRKALSDQAGIASLAPPPVLSINHLQQNGKDKSEKKQYWISNSPSVAQFNNKQQDVFLFTISFKHVGLNSMVNEASSHGYLHLFAEVLLLKFH